MRMSPPPFEASRSELLLPRCVNGSDLGPVHAGALLSQFPCGRVVSSRLHAPLTHRCFRRICGSDGWVTQAALLILRCARVLTRHEALASMALGTLVGKRGIGCAAEAIAAGCTRSRSGDR